MWLSQKQKNTFYTGVQDFLMVTEVEEVGSGREGGGGGVESDQETE